MFYGLAEFNAEKHVLYYIIKRFRNRGVLLQKSGVSLKCKGYDICQGNLV